MKSQQRFSLKQRIHSFRYAINGLKLLFHEEHNSRVHLIFAVLVIVLGFIFKVSLIEWMILSLAIGLVFSLEAVNSAIENIADFISPERHEMIKRIKDLAAGAVLVGAIAATVAGLLIFVPKIISLF